MVTDGEGTSLSVHVSAGQVHESSVSEQMVTAVRIRQPPGRPRRLAGEKACDLARIRRWLRRRSIGVVIPPRHQPHGGKPGRPPPLDGQAYRPRNAIERCIGWLKHARRIATRFQKAAVHFLAMLEIATIQHYFKTYSRDMP